jgi:addiction module HigA family antidote
LALVFRFAGLCVVGPADLLDTEAKETAAMPMKNPPHPGRIVRQDCIDALDLTVTKAAELLSVTRQTLNNLLNERTGISAEMAIRLEKVGWSMGDHWMRLQAAYNLAQARRTQDRIKADLCKPDHV